MRNDKCVGPIEFDPHHTIEWNASVKWAQKYEAICYGNRQCLQLFFKLTSFRKRQSNSYLCGRRIPRVDIAIKLFLQGPNPLFSVLLSLVQISITQASGLITQSLSPARGVKGDGREAIGGMANKWSEGLRKKCQLDHDLHWVQLVCT